jgi:hypothetical protein
MITEPITTPVCFLDPSGYQYLRRTEGMLQLFYETGVLYVECSEPCLLMRDLVLGGVTYIGTGVRDSDTLFINEVNSVEFTGGGRISSGDGDILPDNVPPKNDCFIIESFTWAAYHSLESIQVIAVKESRVFIMTRAQVYQIQCPDNSAHAFFMELRGFATNSSNFHLTQKPADEFWCPSVSRMYAVEIAEVKDLPDALGGMDDFLDLRKTTESPVSSLMPSQRVRKSTPDSFDI